MLARTERERGWLRLALVAFLLQLVWIPAHLALEHHHDEGAGHAQGAQDEHGHEHPDHDPHPVRDHEPELLAPCTPTPQIDLRALPACVSLLPEPAEIAWSAPLAPAPVPRGRSPDAASARAPPSC